MKQAFLLSAAILTLCGAVAGQTSVAIFLDFDSTPTGASIELMKKEAGHLLEPAGLTLDWRLARENRGTESFAALVFLHFRGSCRAQVSPSAGMPANQTLAFARVSNGQVLPFGEVLCDHVREALDLSPMGSQERKRALGVALGRVVAHELYHVLARTTVHASAGLARASESMADLVGTREMKFRDEDAAAMRDRSLAVAAR